MNIIRATLRRPFSLAFFIVCAAVLALGPRGATPYTIISAITILMYVILTLTWTIFSGPTHYLSLGTAAFFGIGVYASAVLNKHLPVPVIAVIGGLISFVLALLIGLLTLRLKGIYFILFTFGVTALVRHSVAWWEAHVTHTVGRFLLHHPNNMTLYYYLLGITLAAMVAAHIVRQSKFGAALIAIGEDEDAAAHIGINVTLVKTLTFAITAVFMGATGAIMANRWTYIDTKIAFDPLISFLPVIMAIFGGTSRLPGPMVGAATFIILREELLTNYPYYYMLVMGVVLIVAILYLPNGLVGLVDKAEQRLKWSARFDRFLARFQEG